MRIKLANYAGPLAKERTAQNRDRNWRQASAKRCYGSAALNPLHGNAGPTEEGIGNVIKSYQLVRSFI
jgi:hypothetical protein